MLSAGYGGHAMAIAGDAAGGGLGFALLLLVQREDLPKPACLVGFSPWTDLTGDSPTLTLNAKRDAMLPGSRLVEAVQYVLNGHDPGDPLASPILARGRPRPRASR